MRDDIRTDERCLTQGHDFRFPYMSYRRNIPQTKKICVRQRWGRSSCDAVIDTVTPSNWEPDTQIVRFVDGDGQTLRAVMRHPWGRAAAKWDGVGGMSTDRILRELVG